MRAWDANAGVATLTSSGGHRVVASASAVAFASYVCVCVCENSQSSRLDKQYRSSLFIMTLMNLNIKFIIISGLSLLATGARAQPKIELPSTPPEQPPTTLPRESPIENPLGRAPVMA